eukprot:GHVT01001624.1.p2 GENE.GHVT01001624.1~~GHVT01001624.1.p2  ORF type:complete len:154 (+),score=21.52 GHVT01001624.1:1682-2143(+)
MTGAWGLGSSEDEAAGGPRLGSSSSLCRVCVRVARVAGLSRFVFEASKSAAEAEGRLPRKSEPKISESVSCFLVPAVAAGAGRALAVVTAGALRLPRRDRRLSRSVCLGDCGWGSGRGLRPSRPERGRRVGESPVCPCWFPMVFFVSLRFLEG